MMINPGELWCSTKSFKHQPDSIIFLEMAIANIDDKIIHFIMWFRDNKLEFVEDCNMCEFCENAKQL